MTKVLELANRLESILKGYLNCGYNDFGVKANGFLDASDWKSAVCFALGDKYASLNRNNDAKQQIDFFLGNIFEGNSIADLIDNYEYYGYKSQEEAYIKVDNIIDEIERILAL